MRVSILEEIEIIIPLVFSYLDSENSKVTFKNVFITQNGQKFRKKQF